MKRNVALGNKNTYLRIFFVTYSFTCTPLAILAKYGNWKSHRVSSRKLNYDLNDLLCMHIFGAIQCTLQPSVSLPFECNCAMKQGESEVRGESKPDF